MNHPEILIVPALMLTDLVLTLTGAHLLGGSAERRAAYELNPAFREGVGQGRWLHPTHIAAMIAMTGALYLLFALSNESVLDIAPLALGLVVGAYLAIIARHLTNIAVFLTLRGAAVPAPQQAIPHRVQLFLAAWHYFGAALPVCVMAAMWGSLAGWSMAAGAVFAGLIPLCWARQTPAARTDASLGASGSVLPRQCAFCGHRPPERQRLIAGLTAMICDECVPVCIEALASEAGAVPASERQLA